MISGLYLAGNLEIMVISRNSQLGLMMDDKDIALEFLQTLHDDLETRMANLNKVHDAVKKHLNDEISNMEELEQKMNCGEVDLTEEQFRILVEEKEKEFNSLYPKSDNNEIWHRISSKFEGDFKNFIDNNGSKIYLICDGVEKCSKMIRIGDNFSSKALRNIHFGKHTYLLGKNEMTRFLCTAGAIKGIYWNRERKITFEYGFDLEGDDYYFDDRFQDEFNRIAKVITFVELGDIEVLTLEKGRNNGKSKNEGKLTNTSEYTVYVVDSSWNQLIVRTEGFAVMGHFRLQPCGINHADRKLIWINAFEKHGYTRKPKASILNN